MRLEKKQGGNPLNLNEITSAVKDIVLPSGPYVEYTFDDEGHIIGAALYGFTKIPDSMFAYIDNSEIINNEHLQFVDLSNSPGLTSIGNWAFARCVNLSSITFPENINSIGKYAFYYCSSLKLSSLPDSITNIGNWTFSNCESLTFTELSLPNLTEIGSQVFQYCTGLTDIKVSKFIIENAIKGFSNCTSLTSVNIPESVANIASAL